MRTDALGRTIEVLDTLSSSTTYIYDAIGQQISMTDPQANTITTAYDIRGNKTSMSDPDKGTWTYRYNALGLLVEQTDAKGQRTESTYDVLERMLTRTDDAGGTPEIATWTYDTATKGVGKLKQVSSPGYLAVNEYDAAGRPSLSTETVGMDVHTLSTTYDDAGRVENTVYPTGLTAQNIYNIHGHLEVVKNATTALEYWKALTADARGNITNFRLGNGVETLKAFEPDTGDLKTIESGKGALSNIQDLQYTFDDLANLKNRTDHNQTLSENFTYDPLNRVTKVVTVLSPTASNTVDIDYDALGNIASKSDVGTYTYGQAHAACGASGHAGPHAVTTVAGTKNATYCYDANGNMTSGDGRTVTYSAFDKPTHIVKGSNTTTISYGPDRARFKRVDVATGGTTVTVYVGGKAFEKISRPGGNIERKHHIGGFAVVTEIDDGSTTTTQTDYLLRDHLGSVDVITDELGVIIRQMSFDAWGKRREVNWTAMVNPTLYAATITTRGFTGHEQLDGVGLVHMNGRVYDPELGRFLSADPFVQDTENLQAWNRYSYVLNNPLSFTDPDGFFFKKLFKAIGKAFGKIFKFIKANFKAILRIAITALACSNPAAPATCAAVTIGTSFGFTLADGGSLGDAFKAAAFSAATVGVFSGVGAVFRDLALTGVALAAAKGAVHGVVSGALSVAQGGSFLQGFAAGAVGGAAGAFVGPDSGVDFFTSTAITAVAGGLAAELTGGKFANGALTAAFANIFNNFARFLSRTSAGRMAQLKSRARQRLRRSFSRRALLRHWCSFHGATRVLAVGGLIEIRNILPGIHSVWSRNEETGETEWKLVELKTSKVYDDTVSITIRDIETGQEQTIVSNRIHPFFAQIPDQEMPIVMAATGTDGALESSEGHRYRGKIENGYWIDAANLKPGYRLLNPDEGWGEVVSVRIEKKLLEAYNLTVKDFNTYFVAANDNAKPVWVHNSCARAFRSIDDQLSRHKRATVNVSSRESAEKLLRIITTGRGMPGPFRNTTRSPTDINKYRPSGNQWTPGADRGPGGRLGTYHWDAGNPNAARGDHAIMGRHLQIHNWEGQTIRIFY